MPRLLTFVLVVCATGACSKSPTDPSASGSNLLVGQAVGAIDGAPSPGLSVQVGHRSARTDQEGVFAIEVSSPGSYDTQVRGNTIVERQTRVFGPTAERARLSLIPASFDLAAFDEMFRTTNNRLQRWTTQPSLVILATVMRYRNGPGDEYEAGDEPLTGGEVDLLRAHLTEGLALLTGNSYTGFASVTVERPAPGGRVNVNRQGHIVVGRYTGIVSMAKTVGYGQWAELPDGTVVGGSIFLDRDFDRNDSRRRLLRIHELGHALGYLHVRSRTSVMNPSIGPEPTDFDRNAATIAFQRPPGNRAPDIDPRPGPAFAVSAGGPQWSEKIE